MKEEYQPQSESTNSPWEALSELPDFATHEAALQSQAEGAVVPEVSTVLEAPAAPEGLTSVSEDAPTSSADLSRQIGAVVDQAIKERAETGDAPAETERGIEQTMELDCDILDAEWEPEFDKRYRRELSPQEKYDRNQRDLASIKQFLQLSSEQRDQYQEALSSVLTSMQDDIRQYRARAAEQQVAPESLEGYNDLYELTCNRRREIQLLEHPEENRKNLTSRQVRLGRELAKDHPLYHDAIEGMDSGIINQNMDAIIESVPPRDFDKLAKLMDRRDKWPAFQEQVQDVLERALNLEDTNIKVEMFAGDPNGEKGSCTPVEDGYLVRLNAGVIGQNSWAYAQVLAHELYHVMQGRVSAAGGTDMADLYDFNMQHYGRPEDIGYQAYRNQLKEAEAFAFMNRFLDEIRAGDTRNRQTLTGRIKHWWAERDTEKLPEDAIRTPTPPIPSSEHAVMMNGEQPSENPDSDSEKISEKA